MSNSPSRPTATAREIPAYLSAPICAAKAQIDTDLAIPPALVELMRESGVFNLLTPRELGGWESSHADILDIYERLARLDGTVAWNVWTANWGCLAVLIDEDAARIVWDGAREPILAHSGQRGEATSVEGGIRVSGTWNFVSGVDIADWLVLAARLDFDRDSALDPDVRPFFVRRDQVTVDETWEAIGLRGTGSHRVTIADAFVPTNLIANGLESRVRRPLFLTFIPALVFAGCAAVAIGLTQAAIDAFVDLAAEKRSERGGKLGNAPGIQSFVASAQAELSAARLLLHAAAAALDRAGELGEPATLALRADLRSAMGHAALVCRRLLTDVYAQAGSSAIRVGSPIDKAFRDGMVALQHGNLAPGSLEDAGRVRFGLQPIDQML